jgi:hypothetical protein
MRKLTMSNLPQKPDNKGFNIGTIKSIDNEEQTSHSLDSEERTYQTLKVVVSIEGTKKPIDLFIYTGVNLSNMPVEIKNEGRKDVKRIYNKFTNLLLKLNVITLQELIDYEPNLVDKLDDGLTKLIDKEIKFKIVTNKARRLTVDVDTIQLVKPTKNN